MKNHKCIPYVVGLCLAVSFSLQAQKFQVPGGSTGADGVLDVTQNTELPARNDGVYNYTTINVAAGVTLTFPRNASNTPIYLLATGDITLNGTIDVSGKAGTVLVGGLGGPGGYDGGNPGAVGMPGGNGLGPGGGHLGAGGVASEPRGAGGGSYRDQGNAVSSSTNLGSVYGGPLLIPPVGGSGGAGTIAGHGGGGGGGGGILVCSDATIYFNSGGTIRAVGGPTISFTHNHGSGGAVRLVCRKLVGDGEINVLGGGNGAGNGWIRIDTHDRTQFNASGSSTVPHHAVTYGSFVVARLANEPALRVLKVAGQNPPANGDPVLLPNNSASTQTIRVEAANFGQSIQVEIALKPVNGVSTFQTVTLDNTTENPKTVDVSVEIPGNTLLHVEVYKR